MATQIGSIDGRRRPLVRIERENGAEGFLALMDTGFNGELFVSYRDAMRLGFTLRAGISTAQLADGQNAEVLRGVGAISWLGRPRRIEVLAAVQDDIQGLADDPIALVGTALLSPHLVLIDFSAGTIEIEEQR